MRIKEFARQIGVSPTTVSQAINGTGRVRPATREMVLRRMKELGYVPNPHAQQLVTGRSHMIALHHASRGLLSDLFLIEITHAVQTALDERGCGLLLDTARGGEGAAAATSETPLRRWMSSGALDGVVTMHGWSGLPAWLLEGASARTPLVSVRVSVGEAEAGASRPDLPFVGLVRMRLETGAEQAADHVADLGHRRVGFIGIGEGDGVLPRFRARLQARGVDLSDDLIVQAGFTPADGARALRELLARPTPPTAIFCRKDDLAIGALMAAARLGLRVPRDLSLIGHDDVPLASEMEPPLTTVDIRCADIGKAAVDLLFALSGEAGSPAGDAASPVTDIPSRLIVRETTAAPGD